MNRDPLSVLIFSVVFWWPARVVCAGCLFVLAWRAFDSAGFTAWELAWWPLGAAIACGVLWLAAWAVYWAVVWVAVVLGAVFGCRE